MEAHSSQSEHAISEHVVPNYFRLIVIVALLAEIFEYTFRHSLIITGIGRCLTFMTDVGALCLKGEQ